MIKEINIPNGWKIYNLGHFMDFKNGINASKESYGKGVKFVNVMDVFKSNILKKNLITGSVEISNQQKSEYSVKYGDILFNRTSETSDEIAYSSVYIDSEEITFGGFVIRGRQKIDILSPDYAKYCFKDYYVRKDIIRKSQGVVRSNIGQKDLNKVNILIPPKTEQKAIAGILEKWDEAIEKTSKLIAAKKKRFEWVRKFSLTTKKDWENIKLKDFLIESNQKSQIENEYKILSSTMNSVEIRSGRVDAVSNIGYKIIRRNQLVLSPQNLWLGNINVNTDYEVGLVSPSYKIFDFNENIILSDFAKFLFKTNKMLWNYKLCSEAGASVVRRNLDLNLFYEIKIFIPALEQQKQIAKTLNTAKKEITILEEILGKYKSQKKGLMQKLLTGKIRVK